MPTLTYTFQPEVGDMIAISRMRFRPRRWMRISAMIVLPLVAVIVALWLRDLIETDDLLALLTTVILMPTYIIGLLTLRVLVFAPRKCRRIFQQSRGLHHPMTVELSDEGCVVTSYSGSNKIPWENFYGHRANSALILLLQSEVQGIFLPSRAFASAAEQRETLALIARRMALR